MQEQEILTPCKTKKNPIDVNSEMTEMLKLSNKHFKVTLINMIQEVRLNFILKQIK